MAAGSPQRHRWHLAAWFSASLFCLAIAGVVLMFIYWPFRYREVHPLLEQEFHCQVKVTRYYRTYFPHPGFVANGVTFRRNGHPDEPPLATVDHLHVVGTWTGLLFTPHTLYQIWVRGIHVRIALPQSAKQETKHQPAPEQPREAVHPKAAAPAATHRKSEPDKLRVETIVADGAVLDLLRTGEPPLHFVFRTLQIHNLHAGQPLTFFARMKIPALNALVEANGKLGPLRPGHYPQVPLQGSYAMEGVDLSRVSHLDGQVSASGAYSGTASEVRVQGKLAIPNFRVGSGHAERLDAAYHATVQATEGRVAWRNVQVRLAGSTITSSGSVAGKPKLAQLEFAAKDGNLEQLLEVVEGGTPSVEGKVSFAAQARFGFGSEPFLKRLALHGTVALDGVTLVEPRTQREMDAFSARARKAAHGKLVRVDASATGETTFREGMAYFRNVRAELPGAKARLHGTFNLLNLRVNLVGTAMMQQSLSKDVTGWKRWLLTPLDPFFRHGKAGAVVPIAITGTARNPKIGQNLLHNK